MFGNFVGKFTIAGHTCVAAATKRRKLCMKTQICHAEKLYISVYNGRQICRDISASCGGHQQWVACEFSRGVNDMMYKDSGY